MQSLFSLALMRTERSPRVIGGWLQPTFIVTQTDLRASVVLTEPNVCGFETVDLLEDIISNCPVAIHS